MKIELWLSKRSLSNIFCGIIGHIFSVLVWSGIVGFTDSVEWNDILTTEIGANFINFNNVTALLGITFVIRTIITIKNTCDSIFIGVGEIFEKDCYMNEVVPVCFLACRRHYDGNINAAFETRIRYMWHSFSIWRSI